MPHQRWKSKNRYRRTLFIGILISAAVLELAVSLGYVIGSRRPSALKSPPPAAAIAEASEHIALSSPLHEESNADHSGFSPNLVQPASSSAGVIPDRVLESPGHDDHTQSPGLPADVIASIESSVVRIEAEGTGVSVGSGFIISDRLLVTCHHVIEGARSVSVVLANGISIDAAGWVAADPALDLAVLECQGRLTLAPALSLRTGNAPRKGDTVFALGSPRGFDGSVSSGIVSGFATGSQLLDSLHPDAEFIQTTAAISPGNSGGPLVDSDGLVVAVNCLSRVHSQNLNFAVGAQHVSELLNHTSHHPKDWSNFPLSKVRRSTQPATAPDNSIVMDALARLEKQNREKREADGRRQAIELQETARQTELTRTTLELASVNQLIAEVEAAGSALVEKRGSVMAAAAGSMRSRDQAWLQYQNLRAELSDLELALYMAKSRGDSESILRVNGRVAQVNATLDNLEQQSRTLSAELTTLDLFARNLLAQINARHLQRANLQSQRADLETTIRKLRVPQGDH